MPEALAINPEQQQPEPEQQPQEPEPAPSSASSEKLSALLDEYESEVAPTRGERNAAYKNLETEWKQKWAAVESDIAQARATIRLQLEAEGVDPDLRASIEAKEVAAIAETHEAARHEAMAKLEEVLPRHKTWLEFLEERRKERPDDPEIQEMIEEAQKSPDPGIEGRSVYPPQQVVLDDLQHVVKDGQVHYRRGLWTAVKDVGERLDVMRLDDRDIEAAMKIAAQKFDKDQPLVLTGDAEFKTRAAIVAARMGLQIANQEPAVVNAYKQELARMGKKPGQEPEQQARSIQGVARQPARSPEVELDTPALLRMEPGWKGAGKAMGLKAHGVESDEVLFLDRDRFNRALQYTRALRGETLTLLKNADPGLGAAQSFGLSADQLGDLHKAAPGLVGDEGQLTLDGADVLLMMSHNRVETGTDRPAEVAQEQAQEIEKQQQQTEEKLMDDNRLVIRNVDRQAQAEREEKKERVREAWAREQEQETELER